jgi:shikimate kinase
MMQENRNIVNIVLVGFMGTGKTVVGTQLADMLHMTFTDTDDIIEEDSGMSISRIFSEMGEEHFRDLESEAVEKVSKLTRHVIATGGGAVIRERNLQNLRSTGMLFCLDATPEVILQRTSQYTHRPLLQVEDPIGQIRRMLRMREPFYSLADHRIDTSQLTVNQVADKIADLFRARSSDPATEKHRISQNFTEFSVFFL